MWQIANLGRERTPATPSEQWPTYDRVARQTQSGNCGLRQADSSLWQMTVLPPLLKSEGREYPMQT
jgi:hypothetical protein